MYGDVMRVKILFNKKENALIQMSDGTQAQLGNYPTPLDRGESSSTNAVLFLTQPIGCGCAFMTKHPQIYISYDPCLSLMTVKIRAALHGVKDCLDPPGKMYQSGKCFNMHPLIHLTCQNVKSICQSLTGQRISLKIASSAV